MTTRADIRARLRRMLEDTDPVAPLKFPVMPRSRKTTAGVGPVLRSGRLLERGQGGLQRGVAGLGV